MLSSIMRLFRKANSGKGHAARTILKDSRRSIWAMADQGVVSLGNFGINIVLARYFAQQHAVGQYGAFWVLMELMFFLNGIQSALLIYPLSIRGAVMDRTALGRNTTESILITLLLGPLMVLSLVITALVIRQGLSVGLWAGAAILLWQIQETTRRSLMAHVRFRAACIGDGVSYCGQLAVVAWLAHYEMLDLARTFQAVALTSALGCLLQALQLGLRPTTLQNIQKFTRECWTMGRWFLFGHLANLFSGILFNWNFAYWAGLDSLGVYYALMNLVRLSNPLASTISSLVTPNAARVRSEKGMKKAKMITFRLALVGGILLGPYLGLLILFPKYSLALAYGRESAYMQYALMVQVAAVSVLFIYSGIILGSFLNAAAHVRKAFIGQVIFAAGFLLIAMPLTAAFGLEGAIWGRLAALMLCAGVNFWFAFMAADAPVSVNSVCEAVAV